MTCRVPGCTNEIDGQDYCQFCRQSISVKALDLMVQMGKNPVELIIHVAKEFGKAQKVADFLGISLPTLYTWITRYFGLTFQQFKQKYVCKGRTCIVVDYSAAGYSWRYTMTDRVRVVRGGCNCFIGEQDSGLMMTTLAPEDLVVHLSAMPSYSEKDGIHYLRYPLVLRRHLPVLQGGDD